MRRSLFGAAAVLALVAVVVTACAVNAPPKDASELTDVLFVTNRADRSKDPTRPRFGGQRGPRSQGICEVRFRDIPLTRGLARSVDTHIPTQVRDVHRVRPIDRPTFEAGLETLPADRPVILFVHGYAYGFGRACRQAGQLQRRLGDQATVILFTWPSDGNPLDYGSDRGDAEWAALDLAEVIDELNGLVGPDRLRIAAHSLGSRTTLAAMTRLQLRDGVRLIADHLVLIAPDYDRAGFLATWPLLAPMVRHATMYASDNDRPLGVSESLHDEPRLGQAGEHLTLIENLQTIDVSSLGRYHPTGHEYHRYHPVVADDFIAVLLGNADAAERPGTVTRLRDGRTYFELTDPAD